MARRVYGKTGCSVEATLSVMGGTWKPVILFYLVSGTKRFMELTRLIPNATHSMLTSQLRELEADGVVVRHVGSPDHIGETIYPIYRDWLPASGEELRDHPLFFHYLSAYPETPLEQWQTDIYVPLK